MKNQLLLGVLAASIGMSLPCFGQTRRHMTTPQVVDPFKQEKPKKDASPKQDSPSPKKGNIDLRPKFEKGQVIRFKMELDQKSKTIVPALDDKPTESTSNQELGLVFKVKDVNDDENVVELSFSHIKMTKKTDEGTEQFDSSQPTSKDKSSEMAPSLRALAGTSFTLHLDKDGNMTRIDGGDALMSLDAFGISPTSLPGGLPTPSASPGATPGGGGFKEALGSIFSIKKGSPLVSVGEEWTNSDKLDTGLLGGFKMTDKNKVKSYNGAEAAISVVGYMEPDSSSNNSLSLVKITDASYTGDYLWNTREGMLRRMNMHQHVVLDAGGSSGVSVTSDMKSVVTRQN